MSAPTLTPADIKEMLLKVADVIIESEEILSQADRDLGDGDHGLGMQRGFSAAKAQLEALAPKTVAEVFTTTGMALMASMGGASGAVMGMLFQSGGAALGANESLDANGLCAFLRGALALSAPIPCGIAFFTRCRPLSASPVSLSRAWALPP